MQFNVYFSIPSFRNQALSFLLDIGFGSYAKIKYDPVGSGLSNVDSVIQEMMPGTDQYLDNDHKKEDKTNKQTKAIKVTYRPLLSN